MAVVDDAARDAAEAARKGDESQPEPKDEPQGDSTDWKAEARKWEERAKRSRDEAQANAEAARKLKELEDADKSEVDRLRETVEAANKRADEAEAKALRAEIAAEKGLSLSQAKRLIGSTREELEADADELLEAFKPSDDKRDDKSRRPQERLRPGASNEDDEGAVDPKKVADAVLSRDY